MLRAALLTLAGILIILAGLTLTACGTTQAQRLKLYEAGAMAAGHPEVAAGVVVVGQILAAPSAKEPNRNRIQP